jgi:hypothetical protein
VQSSRARIVLVLAFVGVLAGAVWWVTREGARESPRARRPAGTTVVEPRAIDGVRVTYRRVPDVESAYRRVAGPDDGVAVRGAAACSRGRSDERAWAEPARPGVEAGRYLCRFEGDHAAMWWTVHDRGLLAHATSEDADLAALFAWWLAHGDP